MALSSIWAKPEQDAETARQMALTPEPESSVWAPMDEQTPTLPVSTIPKVTEPSALQRQTDTDSQKLQKLQWQDQNPWGTTENHPGKWGKIAHTFSTMGNIAGDIFAPATMAMIPGTQLNRETQEGELAKRIGTESGQESENQLRGAQATNQESETAARDQQAKQRADQPATTPKPYTLSTDEGELQWDGNNWSPITVNGETAMAPTKDGSSTSLQKTKGQSAGKEIYANYNPSTGKYTDTQGKELSDFTPYDKPASSVYGSYAPMRLVSNLLNTAYKENPAILPVLGPVLGKIMNQLGATGDASSVFSALPAGQPQNESGAPIGTAMPESPTGTTRTRGQFAGSVLPTMQEASDEIDKLADKLGPMAGRYNELVTGKIGAYGPEFSGLQTDLHNISTAWARLHVDSESARKEFIQDIGAAKDPANLKEKLSHYEHQAQIYKQTGAGRPNANVKTEQGEVLGETSKPDGIYQKPDGSKYRVAGGKVYAH